MQYPSVSNELDEFVILLLNSKFKSDTNCEFDLINKIKLSLKMESEFGNGSFWKICLSKTQIKNFNKEMYWWEITMK